MCPSRTGRVGWLAASLLGTLLGACAVGPDYERPELPAPERFARKENLATPAADRAASKGGADEFWQVFGDPQLDSLVTQALAANNDLRAALAHYDVERGLLREARFDQFPTVRATAEGGHQEVSQDLSYGYPRSYGVYEVAATASWELDLFGRVRRNLEAHRSEALASADDISALQVVIAADVAGTYIELRGLQERLRVALENAKNENDTLRLVEVRSDAGRGAEFDRVRARGQWESSTARVPAFEARIAVDEHRLAVLTGRPPEALIDELDGRKLLPELPAEIDPGTPVNVLRARPDVAAAEERLHAATARVGVAAADLFPRLTLNGLIGTQAYRAGTLFQSGSDTNLGVLSIDWSFLDVGRVRARLAASQADAASLLAQYQRTVLLALEDTENSLVRYSRTLKESQQLKLAAADSAQAVRLAHLRYEAGDIGLYEVLDAERFALASEDDFADGRTRSALAAVALYKALAGGWPRKIYVRSTPTARGSMTESSAQHQ